MVKHLRENQFPVFPEEVTKWTANAIENTEYADYFSNGIPTRGCYQGWLRKMEVLTSPLRPLGETHQAWYIEENLQTYFDVEQDLLVRAHVAKVNPDFEPCQPYS